LRLIAITGTNKASFAGGLDGKMESHKTVITHQLT